MALPPIRGSARTTFGKTQLLQLANLLGYTKDCSASKNLIGPFILEINCYCYVYLLYNKVFILKSNQFNLGKSI